MDITERISASGNVAPEEDATLAFDQMAGTIASVNVHVGDTVKKGDILGSLSNDILRANLEAAMADEATAEANLVQTTDTGSTSSVTLSTTLHDAYLKVENAILGKADSLFTNAVSVVPTINFSTGSTDSDRIINNERLALGPKLAAWKANTDSITVASDTLSAIKKFIGELGTVTNTMTTNTTGLSQNQIDAYRNTINAASAQITVAGTEFINAQYTTNQGNAALQKTHAQIDAIQSQINHTMIRAPFDGVITRVEPKVGEVFAAGTPAFGIISNGVYKIEIHIPETDLAKVALGNRGLVTLDAYGSGVSFPVTITAIDPAQTIVNGVSTYKVTLHFTEVDTRIRSGMTANVSVVTASSTNALVVPTRAIITRGSDTIVLIQPSYKEVRVQTGIKDTLNGFTEIRSGLTEDDVVASFGN
jgi:HlyD family secretion protein